MCGCDAGGIYFRQRVSAGSYRVRASPCSARVCQGSVVVRLFCAATRCLSLSLYVRSPPSAEKPLHHPAAVLSCVSGLRRDSVSLAGGLGGSRDPRHLL